MKNKFIYILLFITLLIFILFKKKKNTTNNSNEYKYSEEYLINKIKSSDKLLFKSVLIEICKKLNIKPIWLLSVMFSESGLNPKAYNKNGGATGLIQFMPETAKYLGTTTKKLKLMEASEQLIYVYKYFKNYASQIKSPADLYLVTFFPIALKKDNDFIFKTKHLTPSIIAKQNPAIDLNKNGQITKKEFINWFNSRIFKKNNFYIN